MLQIVCGYITLFNTTNRMEWQTTHHGDDLQVSRRGCLWEHVLRRSAIKSEWPFHSGELSSSLFFYPVVSVHFKWHYSTTSTYLYISAD